MVDVVIAEGGFFIYFIAHDWHLQLCYYLTYAPIRIEMMSIILSICFSIDDYHPVDGKEFAACFIV